MGPSPSYKPRSKLHLLASCMLRLATGQTSLRSLGAWGRTKMSGGLNGLQCLDAVITKICLVEQDEQRLHYQTNLGHTQLASASRHTWSQRSLTHMCWCSVEHPQLMHVMSLQRTQRRVRLVELVQSPSKLLQGHEAFNKTRRSRRRSRRRHSLRDKHGDEMHRRAHVWPKTEGARPVSRRHMHRRARRRAFSSWRSVAHTYYVLRTSPS